MVKVYAQLDGFLYETEQPDYNNFLANVGDLTKTPGVQHNNGYADGLDNL